MAANPGKVPVYVCKSVKPITGSYGVNYEPIFTLTQWVDRSRVPEFDTHKPDPISTSPQRMNGGGRNGHVDHSYIPPGDFGDPRGDMPSDDIPF
jgi:hypothetical protein